MIALEYVWIGGNNELRSKTRIVDKFEPTAVNELPMWNYDGSSTNQAIGDDSEVLIKYENIIRRVELNIPSNEKIIKTGALTKLISLFVFSVTLSS